MKKLMLTYKGLVMAGGAMIQQHAVYNGPMVPPTLDPVLKGRSSRPCARCGNKFQPTFKRRLLCSRCFGNDNQGGPSAR